MMTEHLHQPGETARLTHTTQDLSFGRVIAWTELPRRARRPHARRGGSRADDRSLMARPGLEPGTPRFSVVCSTN